MLPYSSTEPFALCPCLIRIPTECILLSWIDQAEFQTVPQLKVWWGNQFNATAQLEKREGIHQKALIEKVMKRVTGSQLRGQFTGQRLKHWLSLKLQQLQFFKGTQHNLQLPFPGEAGVDYCLFSRTCKASAIWPLELSVQLFAMQGCHASLYPKKPHALNFFLTL